MRQRAELVTSRWGFYFNAGRNIKKNGITSDAFQAGINIKARLARPELRSVADIICGLPSKLDKPIAEVIEFHVRRPEAATKVRQRAELVTSRSSYKFQAGRKFKERNH